MITSYSREEINLEASTSTGNVYHSQSIQSVEEVTVHELLQHHEMDHQQKDIQLSLHQDGEQSTDERPFFDSDSMC